HPHVERVDAGGGDVDGEPRGAAALVDPLPVGMGRRTDAPLPEAHGIAVEADVDRVVHVVVPLEAHPDVVGAGVGEVDRVVATRAVGVLARHHAGVRAGNQTRPAAGGAVAELAPVAAGSVAGAGGLAGEVLGLEVH